MATELENLVPEADVEVEGMRGPKGDKGDSYVLTEADKEEIAQKVDKIIYAETDKTLTLSGKPADAKAAGDEINDLKTDLSKINGVVKYELLLNNEAEFIRATGNANAPFTPASSTTRILTFPYYDANKLKERIIHVKPTSGYKWILYQFTSSGYCSPFITYTWSELEKDVVLYNWTEKIGLLIAKADNATITLDDYDKVSFTTKSSYEKLQSDTNYLKETVVGISEINFYPTMKNTLIYYKNGVTGESSDYNATDYIPVEEGDRIKCTVVIGGTNADNITGIVGYDSNKQYVTGLLAPPSYSTTRTTYIDEEIIIPSGVSYIRACSANDNNTKMRLYRENTESLVKKLERINTEKIENDLSNIASEINNLQELKESNSILDNEWAQGTINNNTGQELSSATRIRTGFIDVSSYGLFFVKVTDGYKYVVDYYDSSKNILPETEGFLHGIWVQNNNIFFVPETVKYIRLLLSTSNYENISPDAGININVYPKYKLFDNTKTEYIGINNAFAIMKNYIASGTSADRIHNNLNSLPSIVHISDVHGDAIRFSRACDICNRLSADIFAVTGDMVRQYSTDNYSYITNAVTKLSKTQFIQCMGNHDTYKMQTEKDVYDKFFSPLTGIILPSIVDYPTYYHVDVADKKLRLISLNQFQSVNESSSASHNTMHFHQEQINWFVDTLQTTPEDYCVVILIHSPEKTPVATEGYTKFKQKELSYVYPAPYLPITEIVDAFISGNNLSKTYTNGTGKTPETFTVTADFSSKNSGVEFIAYLSGHLHSDNVCYVQNTTNMQLMLNITCANAWVNRGLSGISATTYPNYTELSDLARTETEGNQDAVNVYVIDRQNKNVRIARVGSDMPFDLSEKRDYMVIPYAV